METKVLSFNAKGFVIPNHADKLRWFEENSYHSPTYQYLLQFASMNNIELNGDDDIIQVWLLSEEISCNNIQDHRFQAKLGETPVVINAYNAQYIPLKLLAGMKEGDSKIITIPAKAYPNKLAAIKHDKEFVETIFLKMNITFQQQGFRYAEFGNFEDVIKLVCQ